MAAPLGRRMVKGFRIETCTIKSFKLTRVKIGSAPKQLASILGSRRFEEDYCRSIVECALSEAVTITS